RLEPCARRNLATIAGAALILAAGFGIFALSSFPPTQRFGVVVALGTVASAVITLAVFPRLAAGKNPSEPIT
ncbi:MAG: hypothetical protein HC897_03260, partial [Thermoanaerobaculia bacterium]|nr:hypothetical protein [Thermoanaerobaculia bacterium]